MSICIPDRLEKEIDSIGFGNDLWVVCAYNNDTNSVDEVINILIKATHCTKPEAEMETWEIHYQGKSIVHHASKEECEQAAKIISSIGIKTEIYQE